MNNRFHIRMVNKNIDCIGFVNIPSFQYSEMLKQAINIRAYTLCDDDSMATPKQGF